MDDTQLRAAIVGAGVVLLIPAYRRFQARLHDVTRVVVFNLGKAIGWLLSKCAISLGRGH